MNMYSETVQVFAKAITPIAFFIVLKFIVTFIEEYFDLKTSTVANLFIEAGIAWVSYSVLLKGSVNTDMQKVGSSAGTFIWRMALLFLAPLAVSLLSIFFLMSAEQEVFVAVFLLVFISLLFLMLALFGTMLPAIVDGGDKSWGAAWRRGSKTWASTLGRFVIGPTLVFAAVMGVVIFLDFPSEMAIDKRIQINGLIVSLLVMVVGAFVSVMTAVIVAHAYRRADGAAA